MGATDFYVKVKAKTAAEAFKTARAAALHEEGHSGYTGTIAEKKTFKVFEKPATGTVHELVNRLIETHPQISDTWGPAGCIEVEPGEFLFFGWASE